MQQSHFEFMSLPSFSVTEAFPTRNWHAVHGALDVLEDRELAVYLYLESRAMVGKNHDDGINAWGNITISLEELGAALYMQKCGVQRSLRRLIKLCFVGVSEPGRARGKATTYRIYSQSSVDEIVRLSGCTHYCRQGGARKLYRATQVQKVIAA